MRKQNAEQFRQADGTPRPALSIVVPVYNGAESVGELVEALSGLKIDGSMEIVLVEDAGTDNSVEVCQELVRKAKSNPTVHLIELARNYGEHNAVMAGLQYARGEYIITMDDDLQNPPHEVVRLYNETCRTQNDVTYTYYEEKKHHPIRNLGSWLANKTANFMLDKPNDIYLCSFRCISRRVVDEVLQYTGPYPYVDGLIAQVSNRFGRLKVDHNEREHGTSGYTPQKLIRLWLSILINFSTLPLRLATFFGLLMAAVGLLVVVLAVIDWMRGNAPQGWASVIAAILVFSGAQLVMMGVLGEYVGRIFLSINRKPQFTVRDVHNSASVSMASGKKVKPAS